MAVLRNVYYTWWGGTALPFRGSIWYQLRPRDKTIESSILVGVIVRKNDTAAPTSWNYTKEREMLVFLQESTFPPFYIAPFQNSATETERRGHLSFVPSNISHSRNGLPNPLEGTMKRKSGHELVTGEFEI
jgi:hypothetical protein